MLYSSIIQKNCLSHLSTRGNYVRRLIMIGIMVLLSCGLVHAQTSIVPPQINYQGKLTDMNGLPLTTGNYNLEFNIYDRPTGGEPIWGPEFFLNHHVVQGYFNVILGDVDTNNRQILTAFTGEQGYLGGVQRYLGIKVSNGNEIAPRQRILSAPYALQAEQAAQATQAAIASHHSNIIPVGTIVPYWGTVAPTGWLLCTGQNVPAGSEYNALRSMVGTNVPDLRGWFLRGLDSSGSVDPQGNSRTIGSTQIDAFKSHSHTYTSEGGNLNGPFSWGSGPGRNDTQTSVVGDLETRPKNVAVNFIIKY